MLVDAGRSSGGLGRGAVAGARIVLVVVWWVVRHVFASFGADLAAALVETGSTGARIGAPRLRLDRDSGGMSAFPDIGLRGALSTVLGTALAGLLPRRWESRPHALQGIKYRNYLHGLLCIFVRQSPTSGPAGWSSTDDLAALGAADLVCSRMICPTMDEP